MFVQINGYFNDYCPNMTKNYTFLSEEMNNIEYYLIKYHLVTPIIQSLFYFNENLFASPPTIVFKNNVLQLKFACEKKTVTQSFAGNSFIHNSIKFKNINGSNVLSLDYENNDSEDVFCDAKLKMSEIFIHEILGLDVIALYGCQLMDYWSLEKNF